MPCSGLCCTSLEPLLPTLSPLTQQQSCELPRDRALQTPFAQGTTKVGARVFYFTRGASCGLQQRWSRRPPKTEEEHQPPHSR